MSHSFKLEDNIKNKSQKKFDYSLILMIFFILVSITCIIIYFYLNNRQNYQEKLIKDKDYIYTAHRYKNSYTESDSEVYDEIPSINLVGDTYKILNQEIEDKYLDIKTHIPYLYQYEYSQSKNILSLAIKYSYYENDSLYPTTYFDTYNIDLETGKILTDNDLLKLYNISKKQIEVYLEAKFRGYYDEIVKSGYYTESECSYPCFLKNRGISTNYLDNISFYVDDGNLTLFKYYYKDSDYDEGGYFKDYSYKFLIKK